MTQADSVHSTPPANMSANTSPSRRGFLAQAAVATGSAVLVGASNDKLSGYPATAVLIRSLRQSKPAMAAVLSPGRYT